ncbi:hypothetical protein [Streptomyces sp. NPDC048411]|uniref:hypothetical protein n=1 Tax=Streptomyces sp. NPDC048411 TaxID=3157206 RepID=UPI003453059C
MRGAKSAKWVAGAAIIALAATACGGGDSGKGKGGDNANGAVNPNGWCGSPTPPTAPPPFA